VEVVGEAVGGGVVERSFVLPVGGDAVPGVAWTPAGEERPRPAVLLGHGSTRHKRDPSLVDLARRFALHLGYAAVAIDAPGHGERAGDAARAGDPAGFDEDDKERWVGRTIQAIGEWKALVDDLTAGGALCDGRIGYWGLSMGTAIGLPVVAMDTRITAAVLGLVGVGNGVGDEALASLARRLSVPVLFLLQWDDELTTREKGLALFDLIGSADKTLHVNPGGHLRVPVFEHDEAEAFLLRHLGPS
jgi:dienelactone hydrolase